VVAVAGSDDDEEVVVAEDKQGMEDTLPVGNGVVGLLDGAYVAVDVVGDACDACVVVVAGGDGDEGGFAAAVDGVAGVVVAAAVVAFLFVSERKKPAVA
jgi:hypothetical protein